MSEEIHEAQVVALRPQSEQLTANPFTASHLPGLDGLRAISVIVVVVSHYLPEPWLPDGQFGVLFFFVLSGFLITLLLLKELSRTGTISIKEFYFRRARRILPAFYLSCILALSVGLVRGLGFHWQEMLAASAFVSNYFYAITGQEPNTLAGVTWSLSVEEQFYMLWPGVLFFFRHKLRRLSFLVLVTIVAIWIYRAVMWYYVGASIWYVLFSFETRADAIFIGALVALSVHFGSVWWRRVSTFPAMILTAAALTICAVLSNMMRLQVRAGPGFTAGAILAAILIVQCVAAPPALLQSSVMIWLGQLSYSIYLFHTSALMITDLVLPHAQLRITLPVALALTLTISVISYYGVEQPLRRRRSTKLSSHLVSNH